MELLPLFDRVLLRPVTEQVSDAGIYIPASQTERSQIMTVIAVGDDAAVAVEERVLVSKYAGIEVILDGEKHYVLRTADILAVVK